jgi:hypothetical protein
VRKERRVYGGEVNNYIENEVVLGHVVKFEVEVQVQELVLGRDKCRHARGVPGFARIPGRP